MPSRLGFSDSDIENLNKAEKERFILFLKEMHEAEGSRSIRYAGKDMLPDAFEKRKIISNTAQIEIESIASDDSTYRSLFQLNNHGIV